MTVSEAGKLEWVPDAGLIAENVLYTLLFTVLEKGEEVFSKTTLLAFNVLEGLPTMRQRWTVSPTNANR